MATKKQRRRRAKEQRHDYVWVDDEGKELEPDEVEPGKRESSSRAARPQRQPQAPSWPRTLRRAAIFAPIMLGTVILLSSGLSLGQQILQAAFIVAIFIPFSYFLDRLFYRSFQRRQEKGQQSAGRRGS